MEITHGIALFFAVAFVIIGAIFRKVLWWIVPLGYIAVLAYVAIINDWEIMFFPVLLFLTIISILGFGYSAFKGDLI